MFGAGPQFVFCTAVVDEAFRMVNVFLGKECGAPLFLDFVLKRFQFFLSHSRPPSVSDKTELA